MKVNYCPSLVRLVEPLRTVCARSVKRTRQRHNGSGTQQAVGPVTTTGRSAASCPIGTPRAIVAMLRSRSDLLRERRQQSAGASKQPNTISGGSPLPRNKYLSGEAEAPGLAPTVSYVQESDLRAAPPVSEGAGPAGGDPALRAAARVHSLLERSFAKDDSLRALTLTSAVQRADRTRSWTPTRTQSTPGRGTEGERLTASPQATRHTLPSGRVVSVSHRAEEEATALAEEKWRSAQRIQELELDVKSLHEKLGPRAR